ncbi:MAG: right-handed parallel beta-helix repeat-containing protein [Candidatus Bathyarchaeota archaeon]|nr:right-handed parallel beta-helix repeat-containing protein [Candidatus Bathyarchaeum sp.]
MVTLVGENKATLIRLLILFSAVILISSVWMLPVRATGDMYGTTYIEADGSITPSASPIRRDGNVYTLTGNFNGSVLRVEKSNIIIDGNGHTLYQKIMLSHVTNVTVKNCFITSPRGTGIHLDGSSNSTITNNTIWDCGLIETLGVQSAAIHIHYGDSNLIVKNNITDNEVGMMVIESPNTLVYNNNFVNNQRDLSYFMGPGFGMMNSSAAFDNGEEGNYWSNYNGTDTDGNGIGDSPYIIDENNADNYPLMESITIPEFPSWFMLPLLFIATLVAITYRNKLQRKPTNPVY